MQTEMKQNMNPSLQRPRNGGVYRKYVKRPMDFLLARIAIIVLSPILMVVALLVRIKLGSPVVFKQKRPGFNEKIFTLYKFRTMTDEKDDNGVLLPDNIRLTHFGKSLRSTSLDELPELLNILTGDMAIVGPRPQLVRDMVFMTSEQRMRHIVVPGLTGLAQINGRNNVTWKEKLELDLKYINNISMLNDFKIIIITIANVIKRKDISTNGMETSEDLGEYLLRKQMISNNDYIRGIEKSKRLLRS
jgi:undecaprenyl phosphate N,N'-diacetylbacillosamine 1-phosphate transferase